MYRHAPTVRHALAVLAGLTLLAAGQGQVVEKDISAKGQVKAGRHTFKLQAGNLYQFRVEASGFRPSVNIDGGFFTNQENFDQGDTFQGYFSPNTTKDYQLTILPSAFDQNLPAGLLDYEVKVKPITLNSKPLLQEKGKLVATDPLYKTPDGMAKNTHFKAYTVKLKAKQFYIIDLVQSPGQKIDPYLLLEGPDNKVVATDDDGGTENNSRIIIMPRREGDYRIIATTLAKEVGEFTVTVRTEAGK